MARLWVPWLTTVLLVSRPVDTPQNHQPCSRLGENLEILSEARACIDAHPRALWIRIVVGFDPLPEITAGIEFS